MKIKVLYFHNTSWLNWFGKIIQWTVEKNKQSKKLNAIVGFDENGIITKEVDFLCNHVGILFNQKEIEGNEIKEKTMLIHMVEDGFREEEFYYKVKTRNYYLFEEEFEVDEKLFFEAKSFIQDNQALYPYGWINAVGSFDCTLIFGNYFGSKINYYIDKYREKKQGRYCSDVVIEILFKCLSLKQKDIFKKNIKNYFNSFYSRGIKSIIKDEYILKETTPADLFCSRI